MSSPKFWLSVSTAMKRHHYHSNSYREKHLIETSLQFQRFSPLSSWQEIWKHACCWRNSREFFICVYTAGDCLKLVVACAYETSKPVSTVTQFLQDHSYSIKVTTPNGAIPYMPRIQTHESMRAIPIYVCIYVLHF